MTTPAPLGEVNAVQKLEDLLLVTVPAHLVDSEVIDLRRQALRGIKRHRAKWVLLDFSQVVICDSFFGRFIHSMAESCRLMGAKVVVAGLQDAVVETLVDMGFDLPGVHAVLELDEALALSRASREAEDRGSSGDPESTPDEAASD